MMQKRIVAFLLLLAFIQKMGLELWLHHIFHEPEQARTEIAAHHKAILPSVHTVSCHCLDDTLMPLVTTGIFQVPAPEQASVALVPARPTSPVSTAPLLSSLRGPPAA
jgi:hypothetical protein